METLSIILVALLAIEHLYILILQMFLWEKSRTQKVFGIKKEDVKKTKMMAANQGLYNGFLSAGLCWGLLHPDSAMGYQIQMYFVFCILLAAVYGAFTVKKSILLVQGLPALFAFIILMLV